MGAIEAKEEVWGVLVGGVAQDHLPPTHKRETQGKKT
jgi:hypothetical protein